MHKRMPRSESIQNKSMASHIKGSSRKQEEAGKEASKEARTSKQPTRQVVRGKQPTRQVVRGSSLMQEETTIIHVPWCMGGGKVSPL